MSLPGPTRVTKGNEPTTDRTATDPTEETPAHATCKTLSRVHSFLLFFSIAIFFIHPPAPILYTHGPKLFSPQAELRVLHEREPPALSLPEVALPLTQEDTKYDMWFVAENSPVPSEPTGHLDAAPLDTGPQQPPPFPRLPPASIQQGKTSVTLRGDYTRRCPLRLNLVHREAV